MQNVKPLFIIAAAALAACGDGDRQTFATGTFEATEITVSAEENGRLLWLQADEGATLDSAAQVGLIDTVQLHLRALSLGATRESFAHRRPDIAKQVSATRQQLANAEQERARFAGLVEAGAANRKQLDDADNAVRVLRRQLDAMQSELDNSTQSLNSNMDEAEIQRLMVADRLEKCHIKAPTAGTVLAKYAEAGEYATVGRPLFKLADTRTMHLRAYVTARQLEQIKVGMSVTVASDYGDGHGKDYPGRVTWISDRAEFTPKTIPTDDERADLVYAVKVAVKNDGYLKIGMYGRMRLQDAPTDNANTD